MSVDQVLVLSYGLLILRRLLLARLPAACHRADNGTNSGALARVSRNGANGSAAEGSARSAANSLAAACGWAGVLRWRARSDYCWIDPRRLLCPSVTLRIILFLLLGALALGRIDDRLLGRRRGNCQC
jgi:hypothetical protein